MQSLKIILINTITCMIISDVFSIRTLPEDKWFTQKLDHFQSTDTKVWQQRYWVNETWYKNTKTSPVFLLLAGENIMEPSYMYQGSWLDYAQQCEALCIHLEHRYYGKSQPFNNSSVDNLKYLSSKQVLADTANFIQGMNSKYNLTRSNKWIVIGGSYAGNLAAWVRLKYPHLIHAAISSSAPIEAKANFPEFIRTEAKSLDYFVKGCSNIIQKAANELESLLNNENEVKTVYETFGLCDDIDTSNKYNIYSLFYNIQNTFAQIIQYNKVVPVSPIGTSNLTINDLCSILQDTSSSKYVERMANAVKKIVPLNNETCLNYKYDKIIADLRNTDVTPTESFSKIFAGDRAWWYQTCTEFGFYTSSEKETDLFGTWIPYDYFLKQCADIFGPQFTRESLERNVKKTNLMYGGRDIDIPRVVTTHGTIDPYHVLGKLKTNNPINSPVIIMTGEGHHADLSPAAPTDSSQLIKARQQTLKYIKTWLKEG